MFIKPLYDKEEYDVFLGEGWDNWVRVRALPSKKTVDILAKNAAVNLTDKLKRVIFFKTRKVSND